VLAQTETAPRLAFTGDRSRPLAAIGAALTAAGLGLEVAGRRARRAAR
jgi:hypothetical protein